VLDEREVVSYACSRGEVGEESDDVTSCDVGEVGRERGIGRKRPRASARTKG
jgi:hypothetical protein